MLLVRHSVPAPDPSVPSEEWRLSEEGRALCEPLAIQVGAHEPHGTVMSIYVAGAEPDGSFAYWKTLGLPDVVLL